jgi:hypothetical protein
MWREKTLLNSVSSRRRRLCSTALLTFGLPVFDIRDVNIQPE